MLRLVPGMSRGAMYRHSDCVLAHWKLRLRKGADFDTNEIAVDTAYTGLMRPGNTSAVLKAIQSGACQNGNTFEILKAVTSESFTKADIRLE
jgi:hypothetical protein